MSNRNEDRTLSGSTEIYCDILDLPQTINAIRIKNNYGDGGMVLAKNPTTNRIQWSNVPIADNTITTNMIQNLAITNAKLATNSVSNDKIIDNTIEGNKLNSAININTTGALTIGGITTLKNIILFYDGATPKGSYLPSTDTLQISNIIANNGLSVGSGNELVVGTGNATFGADVLFGGEVEMSVGGTEVFNMNSHNLTNGGTANFDTLNLGTALNMLNLNLDLGSGNLTANNIDGADISGDTLSIDTGTTIIDATGITLKLTGGGATTISLPHATGVISCLGLNTNNNAITSGGGNITTGGGGVETSGGYVDTNGGNLSMNNGDIIGANDIQCVNLDAGTIEGPTNLNGALNVGYGSITSANNGRINIYGGNYIDLSTGQSYLSTLYLNGTGNVFNTGGGDMATKNITAQALELSDTTYGLGTHNITTPDTAPIVQYNLYSYLNDIPRIIACKSFFADHLYSRTITTTYKNIDKDTTTLNVAFNVPPSCKILVEVGFYVGTTLSNERLMLKLVNSAGTEFYTAYINDSAHGHSTENMECQFASSYGTRGQTIITKFFLSFPTSARGNSVNLQPQASVNAGSCNITTGGSSSSQSPPMYVKVESLGSTSAFNWHYETSAGGDDY